MADKKPRLVIFEAERDYLKNMEGSRIYKEYAAQIPIYNEGENKYNVDNINKKYFFRKLYMLLNEIASLKGTQKKAASAEFIVFLLENLADNPKYYNAVINKKIPPSVNELHNALRELTKEILKDCTPEPDKSKDSESTEALKDSLVLSLKALKEEKEGAVKNAQSIDEFELQVLAELVARVSIHHSVKGYIYNAGNRVSRNKALAKLERIATDENYYATFTDEHSVNKMYTELCKKRAVDVFMPLACDCFGNMVAIAGSGTLKRLPPGNGLRICNFVVMKLHFNKSPSRNYFFKNNAGIPLHEYSNNSLFSYMDYTGDALKSSYKEALSTLMYNTQDCKNSGSDLYHINEKYINIIMKYGKDEGTGIKALLSDENVLKDEDKYREEFNSGKDAKELNM